MKYIDMWGRKAKGVVFNSLWSEKGYGVMCSLKLVSEMVLCVFSCPRCFLLHQPNTLRIPSISTQLRMLKNNKLKYCDRTRLRC